MPKFFGKIGYSIREESKPGIFTPKIVEKDYYGDIIKNSNAWKESDRQFDELTLDMKISIVADQFAMENSGKVRYVEVSGSKWKITGIVIDPPRQILTIGGLYNG